MTFTYVCACVRACGQARDVLRTDQNRQVAPLLSIYQRYRLTVQDSLRQLDGHLDLLPPARLTKSPGVQVVTKVVLLN